MSPEPGAIRTLDRRVRALIDLDRDWHRIPRDRASRRAAGLAEALFRSLARCERLVPADELRLRVEPARQVFATSELIRRMQTWPRGFAGDFETIEYLVAGRNRAPRGSLAHVLEGLVLDCPAARQHRQKLRHQARQVERTITRQTGSVPRVLSIACGGASDLIGLVERSHLPFELVVNDIDEGALEVARDRLAPLGSRVRLVPGNALRIARDVASLGRFDLVVAGGLFDYLDDRAAVYLLRAVSRLLRPAGRFFWTNIARGNPQRPWMELLGDWRLIERDRHEIFDLTRAAGIPDDCVRTSRERTGLAWLVRAHAAPSAGANSHGPAPRSLALPTRSKRGVRESRAARKSRSGVRRYP